MRFRLTDTPLLSISTESCFPAPAVVRQFIDRKHALRLERVVAWRSIERGAEFDVDSERFRVEILRPDVARLTISRNDRFDEQPSFAKCREDPAPVAFETDESSACITIRTQLMRIAVYKAPFRFEAFRADGSPLIESVSADGEPLGYEYLNDRFCVVRRVRPFDAIYGLGEKSGPFDRRGGRYTLWNYDILSRTLEQNRLECDPEDAADTRFDPYYVSIPFFYHATGSGLELRFAGFFVDNGYRGRFDFGDREELEFAFDGGQYSEYVFAGPSMAEVLEAYTWLTGRARLPPLWSLGFHQCRWWPYTEAEVLALGEEYRTRSIPCDALWLDIDYMDGYRVFTWNAARFPDVPGMLGQLRERGFRCITIVDPGVKFDPGYRVFDEAREQNLLCKTEDGNTYIGIVWPGRTAFPDFVKAETRAWWGRLNAEHVASGLAGIWNDMNEPATGDVDPFAMRFDRDGANYPHERYHNQYALLMAMGTHEGLMSARPDERPFILSRGGFAGIQRYAANWMGDNFSRWDHLAMSVPMAAGLGISGQPFVGADIPGFDGVPTAELMVRWMQYGTLTPFCRSHGMCSSPEQYPWSFGPAVERLCREAIALRYRLLPYIYTAFVRATETGEPVQRPLVYDFAPDARTREIDDQYLFGDALLVAPVLEAGQSARHVHLPEGTWVNWHTGETSVGPRVVTAAAPIDRIPIFARGGRVIPMLREAPASTLGYAPEVLDLVIVVPADDGVFHSDLQEDDGVSFAALTGARVRTRFELTRVGKRVRVVATVIGNGYPEFRRSRFRFIVRGANPADAALDGKAVTFDDGRAEIENRGSGFQLAFDV